MEVEARLRDDAVGLELPDDEVVHVEGAGLADGLGVCAGRQDGVDVEEEVLQGGAEVALALQVAGGLRSELSADGCHLAGVVRSHRGSTSVSATVGGRAISSVLLLHGVELGVEPGFHAGHDLGEGGLGDDGPPSRGEDSRRSTPWT
jgi:hypothetical protein